MVLSMTGYGKAVAQLGGKKITVEIRSLNSKQTDINVRVPQYYREKELAIRELLATRLKRGKIDFNLYAEVTGVEEAPSINKVLVLGYVDQLKEIMGETSIDGDALAVAMRMPDVLQTNKDDLSAEEWAQLQDVVNAAIDKLVAFRQQEGVSLQDDFAGRIGAIEGWLQQVDPYEAERIGNAQE